MTRPRRSTTSWLDSFEGEAIWPALPLPAVELYEEDLHARFEKLKAFLGDHLPAVDQRASQQPAAATEVAQDVMRVYGSPPRHFRARCRFGLGRDADGHMHYFVWNNADQCPSILGAFVSGFSSASSVQTGLASRYSRVGWGGPRACNLPLLPPLQPTTILLHHWASTS